MIKVGVLLSPASVQIALLGPSSLRGANVTALSAASACQLSSVCRMLHCRSYDAAYLALAASDWGYTWTELSRP
jgi:hypothetical protein